MLRTNKLHLYDRVNVLEKEIALLVENVDQKQVSIKEPERKVLHSGKTAIYHELIRDLFQ